MLWKISTKSIVSASNSNLIQLSIEFSFIPFSAAYLFVSFDKLWIRSKPSSVMEFSHIRDKFEAAVIKKLEDDKAVFRWDPYLEII